MQHSMPNPVTDAMMGGQFLPADEVITTTLPPWQWEAWALGNKLTKDTAPQG